MVMVPVRPFFPFFFETEKPTVPELVPEAPDVIVIHEALDLAVQGHPPLAVTEITPDPAVVGNVNCVGDAETLPDWKLPVMLYG